MVQKAVEHGADRRRIPQQLAPVFHRSIGSHQHAGAFIAPHGEIGQFFGAAVRGSLRIPKSSMMSSGTVVSDSKQSLRVPSRVASAISSSRAWVSR